MFISGSFRIPLTEQDHSFNDVNPFKADGINHVGGRILWCLRLGPRVAESKPDSLIGGLLENLALQQRLSSIYTQGKYSNYMMPYAVAR